MQEPLSLQRELMCCPLGTAGRCHLQQKLQIPQVFGAQMSRPGRHQLTAVQQLPMQRLAQPCGQLVVLLRVHQQVVRIA